MARSSFSPFKPPSPRRLAAGFEDLRLFLGTRGRADYVIAILAAGITAFTIFAFWHDSRFPAQQQIIFVHNWRADRTDAEIIAEQKKDRIERDQANAERRAFFQKAQKATSGWL
ncbi:hypothetical protein [Sphingomonas abietis]|uniref:Uncharacterized protein n=1 Tax=Sphingomonas abietis TaxID=3012344 RepID=A0ABY7NM73_9SPHN|nr:hypothetical protein [Sphingomonas abietis]WBO22647.1 hypothetical protein PBT88_00380 [Sphingomonas abietis]